MKRPNILWYCTDQQRFDTIGALGNPHVRTPTIDSLVAEGTTLTHAYCQSPICTPSRSSFLTGMYPSRVHNTRNGNESFPEHPPLITRLLADAGYCCGLVGKFHLQSAGRRTEPRMDDGYSYWQFSHAPRDDWPEGHDYAEWVRERGGDLDVMRVTIRGAGMDKSILSFKGQVAGAEGLLVTASDFTIEGLAIEDTIGDALKISEGNNIVIRGVRTEWTDGYKTENGAYGIYPVQTTNVLMEDNVAIGASDAGIYVGQSG